MAKPDLVKKPTRAEIAEAFEEKNFNKIKALFHYSATIVDEVDAEIFYEEIFATYLEKYGADLNQPVDQWNNSLIGHAVNGGVRALKFMLSKKIDVNSRDALGQTPLIIAAIVNRPEVVKFLIEQGADLTVMDNNGRTALINAIQKGHLESAEMLIACGVDVNFMSEELDAPLIWAVFLNKAEMVAALLKAKGVNVNLLDKVGSSIVENAAMVGSPEIIRLLLASGAKKDSSDWLNFIDLLALRIETEKDGVRKSALIDILKDCVGETEVDKKVNQRIKLSVAKLLLKMFYSKQDAPSYQSLKLEEIIRKFLPEEVMKQLPEISFIFDEIAAGRDFQRMDGRYLKVIALKIPDHVAYALVEYEDDGSKLIPRFITYVDGAQNSKEELQKIIHTALKFEIDQSKCSELGFLESELGKISKSHSVILAFSKVVRMDADDFKLVAKSVLSRPQKRGNCAGSSLFSLVEALIVETGEGISGNAEKEHRAHQDLKFVKHAMIFACAKDVCEIAGDGDKEAQKIFLEVLANAQYKIEKAEARSPKAILAGKILKLADPKAVIKTGAGESLKTRGVGVELNTVF